MEACRAAQQELTQLARQAKSHKSKCSEVAAAGAYAMAALEELLRFPERDMVRQLYAEKQLQQLCGRVLFALQQARAEVQEHGSGDAGGSSGGLLACCFGGPPQLHASQLKFDRLAAELASLGQQVMAWPVVVLITHLCCRPASGRLCIMPLHLGHATRRAVPMVPCWIV